MMTFLLSFYRDEHAATAIEYGLIVALIAIAAIAALTAVGGSLSNVLNTASSGMAGA